MSSDHHTSTNLASLNTAAAAMTDQQQLEQQQLEQQQLEQQQKKPLHQEQPLLDDDELLEDFPPGLDPITSGSSADSDTFADTFDRFDNLLLLTPANSGDSSTNTRTTSNSNSNRRRARTLDVEWGGNFAQHDSAVDLPSSYAVDEEEADNEQQDHDVISSVVSLSSFFLSTPEDDLEEEDDARTAGPSSRGTTVTIANSTNPSATGSSYYFDPEVEMESHRQYQRCRHALHKSRVLRGLLLLCIYGSTEIWPNPETILLVDSELAFSTDTYETPDDAFATKHHQHSLRRTKEASNHPALRHHTHHQPIAVGRRHRNSNASNTDSVSKTVPLAQLPHFQNHVPQHPQRRPPAPSAAKASASATATASTDTTKNNAPSPVLAATTTTATTSAVNHSNKTDGYHKKTRPILSYAHSYRLSQEALVFGHESNINFLSDSSDASTDIHGRSTNVNSNNNNNYESADLPLHHFLLWMTLVILISDTLYREYQHRQFQSRLAAGTAAAVSTSPGGTFPSRSITPTAVAAPVSTPTPLSTRVSSSFRGLLRQRHPRSTHHHHRRSPSPQPCAPTTSTAASTPSTISSRTSTISPRGPVARQRLSDPTGINTAAAAAAANTLAGNTATASAGGDEMQRSSSWRPRRRFDTVG